MTAEGLTNDALQALDSHLRHWAAIDTPAHRDFTARFIGAYFGIPGFHELDGNDTTVEEWLNNERVMWDHAPTVVLSDEPYAFITEAAALMPDAVLTEDIIPPAGVLMRPGGGMLVDYSIPVEDQEEAEVWEIVAIAWRIDTVAKADVTEGPGASILLYGRRAWAHEVGMIDDRYSSEFVLIDRTPWGCGVRWAEGVDDRSYEERKRLTPLPDKDGTLAYAHVPNVDEEGRVLADAHVARVRRFLLALWTFMADEVVVPHAQRLPRPNQKRLVRSGRMAEIPEDGALRIIHLRRYAESDGREPDPDAEAPNWSHRWYVRGHWRRLASGRVTWVRGHVKGPEDRPLVLKNNIVAVHR